MPLFDEFENYGRRWRQSRRERQTARILNSLPPEIQKDLGWSPPPPSMMARVYRSMLKAIRR